MFPDDLWRHVVCKGQDAICFTCRGELGDENTLRHMCCDECGTIKPKDKFSDEQRERWQALDGHAVLCMSCEGTSSRRSLAELVACNGELCLGRHIPTYNFDQNLLTYWRSKQLSADVHCARCYIRSDTCNRKMAGSTKEYECVNCRKTMHINLFSAVTIKEWLADGGNNTQRWRCYECKYPSCNQCSSRPVHAIPHNAMVQGKYYCEDCRCPPCKVIRNGKVCGNRRDTYGEKHRFKEYICPWCRESGNKPAVSLDAGIPAAADPFSMA